MSLKFEGEVLEAIRKLEGRVRRLEDGLAHSDLMILKQSKVDEVSDWLSKRRKDKTIGRI
jgi:hypothetical protein